MIESRESIRVTISPLFVPWSSGHDRSEVTIQQFRDGLWTVVSRQIFTESKGQNLIDAMAWATREVARLFVHTQPQT